MRTQPIPAAALAAALVASPSTAQDAVAFAVDGCQGPGIWTSNGAFHPAPASLPALQDGLDLFDLGWCAGDPYGAPPPVLTRVGGEIGASLDFGLSGRPGEFFLLVPSFSTGPIPISAADPLAPVTASVGLDLIDLWTFAALDAGGQGAVSLPLPALPQLTGLVLHTQWVGISPTTFVADRVSNRTAIRLHNPGSIAPTHTAELSRLGQHEATPLLDGRVLLTGGTSSNTPAVTATSDRIELYDPHKEAFYPAASTMSSPRILHTATLLSDGRVLILGGYDDAGAPLPTAELFDPSTGATIQIPAMPSPRAGHATAELGDGRILVAGGYKTTVSALGLLPDDMAQQTLIYDPVAQSWSLGPSLSQPTVGCALVALDGGDALLIGGLSYIDQGSGLELTSLSSVRRYSTALDQWQAAPSLPRAVAFHAALKLANGEVVVAGGEEVSGTSASASRLTARFVGSGWVQGGDLAFGRVAPELVETESKLIVGGGFSNGFGVGALERSDKDAGFWFVAGNTLLPRPGQALAPIEGGRRVLITGNPGGFSDFVAENLRP